MDTLSASESFVEVALAATAIAVVLWSLVAGIRSTRQSPATPPTGELVWTIVAAAVLVGTAAAVHLGAGHGL
ncbi:MAG TPA: hypothetical protein VN634_05990 [Candidatus Limnocylindrales bacterium]|nr:hypothetical protein [Candidatus Limnocylindrales bacterium]